MGLFEIIAVLVVVGVVMWAINQIVPMDPRYKQILNVVVIVFVVLWIASIFLGGMGTVGSLHMGGLGSCR